MTYLNEFTIDNRSGDNNFPELWIVRNADSDHLIAIDLQMKLKSQKDESMCVGTIALVPTETMPHIFILRVSRQQI